MYTIVMDKYKNLNTTVRTSIFQQESMVDKIQFLIPPTYNGVDISDYVVTLKYVDPNGNFHSEVLTKDEEMYKDYLRYALPVTTKLTQVSGTLTLRLTFIKFEGGVEPTIKSEHVVEGTTMVVTEGQEGDTPIDDPTTMVIDKLESNSTTLMIQRPNGFNDYVNFEDIEAYKAQIANLSRDVADMSERVPNDLQIGDNQNLHLVHDDTQIGEGVEILMPSMFDDVDDDNDGIIDVDNLKPDPEPSPSPYAQFIEL